MRGIRSPLTIFSSALLFSVLDDLIMCLEEGCGTTLQLIKPNGAKDGGKADGFGSLSVYRVRVACFILILKVRVYILSVASI